MTTFSFTTGNPAHLTAGAAASMTDIGGSFTDVQTFLNGGNIDTTNLATSAKPVTILGAYRTIAEVQGGAYGNTAANGLNVLGGVLVGSGTQNTFDKNLIPIAAADYAVSGLTAKLRVRGAVASNATSPALSFTFGLYPVSATAGGASQHSLTLGTLVSGSATSAGSPGASGTANVVGSDFSLPSDGLYAFGVVTSGAMPANAAGIIIAQLQLHHV